MNQKAISTFHVLICERGSMTNIVIQKQVKKHKVITVLQFRDAIKRIMH